MPGPGSSNTVLQAPNAYRSPEEQAFAGITLSQASKSLLNMDLAQSPLTRAATIDARLLQAQATANNLDKQQQQLYDKVNGIVPGETGGWTAERVEQNRLLALQAKEANAAGTSLLGEKQLLPMQVEEAQKTQRLSNLAAGRMESFLSGKDLGVSPEERELITQGISGISQDVATTRGLNRSDVPVMQAIAPAVSQALLSQANANRALFTGINQFQQGMGLSQQQTQMGLAAQNPAAGMAGAYLSGRGSSYNTQQQGVYGAADYGALTGNVLGGAGLGLYGLSAAGLIGGGTTAAGLSAATYGGGTTAAGAGTAGAAGTYGGSMAVGCWIAEAIYGPDAPETGVIRWWLTTHFIKRPVGRFVMAYYRKYGRQIAGYVQRWSWLKPVLRPLFNLALKHGLAAAG